MFCFFFSLFFSRLTVLLLILEEALTAKEHTPTPTPNTNTFEGPAEGPKHINNNPINGIEKDSNLDLAKVSLKPEGGEPKLNNNNNHHNFLTATQASQFCWTHEPFTIVEPCSPCTSQYTVHNT